MQEQGRWRSRAAWALIVLTSPLLGLLVVLLLVAAGLKTIWDLAWLRQARVH